MLLSGITTGNQPFGPMLVMSYVLIITTTVYPLVYVICLLFAIARIKENKQKIALGFSICSIGYLAVIVAVFEIGRLFGWT
jgi:ABC-type glycerol-3-phosphate transport system permease component